MSCPDHDFRLALGARLLVARVQDKKWNELAAARAAKIEPKTVRRIERGLNYEIESLEKYALALGRPLAAWLRDLLTTRETSRANATAGSTFPKERRRDDHGSPTGPDRRDTE